MPSRNSEPAQGKLQLPEDVLGAIVEIAQVHLSVIRDRRVQRILYNPGVLARIELRGKDQPGVVIDDRGEIRFYLCSLLPNREKGPVLDVSLHEFMNQTDVTFPLHQKPLVLALQEPYISYYPAQHPSLPQKPRYAANSAY